MCGVRVVFRDIHRRLPARVFFFFNDTATTEIYTLSLHDALPISFKSLRRQDGWVLESSETSNKGGTLNSTRSEEHTSELQSLTNLVCRLLLEKKKKEKITLMLTTWIKLNIDKRRILSRILCISCS